MNNEQLMNLDGVVYLRKITSGKFENVSKFIEYITTDENGNISPEEKINETKIRSKLYNTSPSPPLLIENIREVGYSLTVKK